MKERLIPVKPIASEAFAPYGRVFAAQPGDPDGRAITGKRLDDSDLSGGRVFLGMYTYRWRDLTFTHLEQHASFTQAFIPIDGKPATVSYTHLTLPTKRIV